MKPNKLSVSELLRLACCYALSDQQDFIDCVRHCTSPSDIEARERAEAFVKQLREYKQKRWGQNQNQKFSAATEQETQS